MLAVYPTLLVSGLSPMFLAISLAIQYIHNT